MARKANPDNCAYLVLTRLTDAAFKLHQARRTERLNWVRFTPAQRAEIERAWKRLYAVARGDADPVFEGDDAGTFPATPETHKGV